MTGPDLIRTAEAIRNFNHFYARHAGGLQERIRSSKFSTNEVRLLHALAIGGAQTSATVARQLNLDTGYLSRLLTRFESRGYITRRVDTRDSRRHFIILTSAGRATFDAIDSNGIGEMSVALRGFTRCERAQTRVVDGGYRAAALSARRLRAAASARRAARRLRVDRRALRAARSRRSRSITLRGACGRNRRAGVRHRSGQRAARVVLDRRAGERSAGRCGGRHRGVGQRGAHRTAVRRAGARRRGLGQRLVDACSAFASEAGFERLTCCIEESRTDLHRLAEQTCFALRERVAAGSVWQRSVAARLLDGAREPPTIKAIARKLEWLLSSKAGTGSSLVRNAAGLHGTAVEGSRRRSRAAALFNVSRPADCNRAGDALRIGRSPLQKRTRHVHHQPALYRRARRNRRCARRASPLP